MKRSILLILLFALSVLCWSQADYRADASKRDYRVEASVIQQYRQVESYFREAYELYPTVPRGVLETVAFTYSRFCHLVPDTLSDTPSQIPPTYGVMGLTLNGKGYFRENLKLVSRLSGISVERIMASPRDNIVAYAAAYADLQRQFGIFSVELADQFPILDALSELPLPTTRSLDFATQSLHYAYCFFTNHIGYRNAVGMLIPKVDILPVFGTILPLLQSGSVNLLDIEDTDNENDIKSSTGFTSEFKNNQTDYSGALWMPAGTCNYSSRNGHAVSAITIHYTQGTYSGAIAWFQNCTYNGVGAQASAHYVLRSIDGQVAQMVRESAKAWHVGNSNSYTVGLEHEAYGNIASFFTPAMYQSSANLTRDICERHSISPLRMFYRDTLDDGTVLNSGLHSLGGESACVKIRGHQHFPSQTHTDPGPYWDWNYYYKLVNADTPITEFHSANGSFADSGGETANYGTDERMLYLIQVPDAEYITLTFSDFDLEDNYDFMWIYDGSSVFSPKLGRWNTTSPGTVVSSGDALLVEFRSDCATTAAGWIAHWSATFPETDVPPTTAILNNSTNWETSNFSVHFEDADDHGIAYRFYQVMGYDGARWTAMGKRGFACDNFDDFNSGVWRVQSGSWGVNNHRLTQTSLLPATICANVQETNENAVLFDIYASVEGSADYGRVEFILSADRSDVRHAGTAYSVVVKPMERRMEIYRWVNGDIVLVDSKEQVFVANNTNYLYRVVCDRAQGRIIVFRDGTLLMDWRDPVPLAIPGQYVMIHTDGLSATFDNWRVYKSRAEVVNVCAGMTRDSDLPWQALNGVGRAKIKSIVMDDAFHFSTLVEQVIKTDFTSPTMTNRVEARYSTAGDAAIGDILDVQWLAASDDNSGIAYYDYEVWDEDAPLAPMFIGRTNTNRFTYGERMIAGHRYFAKVAAVNSAGLKSRYYVSNYVEYSSEEGGGSLSSRKNKELAISVFPNPAEEQILVTFGESEESDSPIGTKRCVRTGGQFEVMVWDAVGRLMYRCNVEESNLNIDISQWEPGVYILQVYGEDGSYNAEKIIKK